MGTICIGITIRLGYITCNTFLSWDNRFNISLPYFLTNLEFMHTKYEPLMFKDCIYLITCVFPEPGTVTVPWWVVDKNMLNEYTHWISHSTVHNS
jgi:hypothetical protein